MEIRVTSGWVKEKDGWWGLREQGGHAVAEAVWIWVPKGAGPLEKPREVRLAMNKLLGIAAVEHCQQHQDDRVLCGGGQVGVDFARAREGVPGTTHHVEDVRELRGEVLQQVCRGGAGL